MTGIRRAFVKLSILACAGAALAPATASAVPVTLPPGAPGELAPRDEGFDCRASSVRVADGTAPDSTKFEPFVANRDVFPCIDDDAGVPSLTQVPGDAAADDPRAILGGAFARTRDGEAEDPGETPPPPETLDVVRSEAGAAFVFLTNGTQSITASAVRSEATVRCNQSGQPVFESSSEAVGIVLGVGPGASLVLPPPDNPATPADESHIHIGDEAGPIHINHSETTFDAATGITTHTRKALWLENGENGADGEIVVGESKVSIHGNPCTGRITVVKNRIPDGEGLFSFSGLGEPFTLEDDGDPNDGSPRFLQRDVAPGQYTISETDPDPQGPDTFLSEATCVGDGEPPGGSTSGGDAPAISVGLARDEDVTCTFLNIARADAICPPGSTPNEAGECVITETHCPPGSTRNAAGQCVVDQTVCPPGSTEHGGQCVRNETVCPPGSTRNTAGECVVNEVRCPPGSERNSLNQCVSTQVVREDVPRGGVVVPIDQVPGARDSICSRPGFGLLVAVVGTNGPDRITGTNRSDRIFAFGGRDRVSGGRGNDCVEGGSGNDNLDGSNGNDALLGDTGRDILNGGTGRDLIEGGSGIDRLNGGSGSDRLLGGANRDKLSGGLGNDRIDGGAARDFIDAGPGRDNVRGGPGDDAINVAESGRHRDTVDCGPGRDTVRITPDDRVRNCERILVLRVPRRR